MLNLKKTITILFLGLFLSPLSLYAHCQIPCGIYDDHARVVALLEDVATIRKSVNMMQELAAKKDVQSKNQFVRWVVNKEKFAEKIIATMSNYFLTQRVKPSQKDYAKRLANHHAVIIAAMKAKQGSDLKVVNTLESKVKALNAYYKEHKH